VCVVELRLDSCSCSGFELVRSVSFLKLGARLCGEVRGCAVSCLHELRFRSGGLVSSFCSESFSSGLPDHVPVVCSWHARECAVSGWVISWPARQRGAVVVRDIFDDYTFS